MVSSVVVLSLICLKRSHNSFPRFTQERWGLPSSLPLPGFPLLHCWCEQVVPLISSSSPVYVIGFGTKAPDKCCSLSVILQSNNNNNNNGKDNSSLAQHSHFSGLSTFVITQKIFSLMENPVLESCHFSSSLKKVVSGGACVLCRRKNSLEPVSRRKMLVFFSLFSSSSYLSSGRSGK